MDEWFKEYDEEQLKLNIKPGERVLILRPAEEGEGGWCDCWDEAMYKYIDTIGTVITVYSGSGVAVRLFDGESYNFPYFILQFIDREIV